MLQGKYLKYTEDITFDIPKLLTAEDLVEGEIYFYNDKHIAMYPKGLSVGSTGITRNENWIWNLDIKYVTPIQRKHWNCCNKQDKFIEQSELDKYDDEGNLTGEFKVGDYVTIIDDTSDSCNEIGDIGIITKLEENDCSVVVDSKRNEGNWSVYTDLRHAAPEEIAKVTKPTKEFDRSWYVEVSSQEEADAVFKWLREQGEETESEKVYLDKGYKFIYFRIDSWWAGSGPESFNRVQRQLSDILPNCSKVNRNVYYEVSNQEQYNKILDWLESKGEEVDRNFDVMDNWRYVFFLNDDWSLNNKVPSFLKKAELKQETKVQNSVPEIAKVTNRFKAQPVRKRVIPEIY